jgi:molybdate transport system substrate-binding protein
MTSQPLQLHVFSAGAVAPPLQEAASIFEKRHAIRIKLTVGKPANLLASIVLSKQGDLISCGAEFILDEAENSGLVSRGSRKSLGFRRSVIIVPVGNPGKIASLTDLCREGVRIGVVFDGCLKGVWDDIASKAGLTDQIRKNITQYADTCGSLMGLIHQDKVDAIFGWNAFQNVWPNTCEVIELPEDLQVFRSTVIGMIRYTKNRVLAQRFIDFLVSDESRKIYSDYGWIYHQ